jgi:hypothetical protein
MLFGASCHRLQVVAGESQPQQLFSFQTSLC